MTPDEMHEAIIADLPKKTGKTLEQWISLLTKSGPKGTKDRINWLKTKHGMGYFQAAIIAGEAAKPDDYKAPAPKELLDKQYSGERSALRPVYNKLAREVRSLGKEARLEPRKTYVSLARKRQFGIVQPSRKNRIDLGLRLPGTKAAKRLKSAGSFGPERITHRIEIKSLGEVDAEVKRWLKKAYNAGN